MNGGAIAHQLGSNNKKTEFEPEGRS
jgi:hypothetical protein